MRRTLSGWRVLAALGACGMTALAAPLGAQGVSNLEARVAVLAEALGEARAEADLLRARLERRGWQMAGGGVVAAPAGANAAAEAVWQIRAVNGTLGVVVVEAGRREGLRPGMRLAVVRGRRGVAVVRVVDVRERIAGAVLERSEAAPGPGDRLVLLAGRGE